MKHHEDNKQHEDNNFFPVYYLVGFLAGLFTGVATHCTPGFTLGLGVTGLLFAGFFLRVFVKGHEKHV